MTDDLRRPPSWGPGTPPPKPDLRARVGSLRPDHVLIVLGSIVVTAGSAMPWLVGSTRARGNIDWTGFNDTGEGAMLMGCAFVSLLFVRWRGILEEMEPRWRWLAFGAGLAALALWLVAFEKALSLSWWEIAPGARPQPGIFVALVGVLLLLAGGWLAARLRANEDVIARSRRREAERRRRRPRAPEIRVGADGYATRGKVDRTRPPDD